MTKKEYEAKMAALEPLEDEQRKSITCSLLGHSHITTGYFGYVYPLEKQYECTGGWKVSDPKTRPFKFSNEMEDWYYHG